jgi:hypothetical protein
MRFISRWIAVVVATFLVSGCAATYEHRAVTEADAALDRGSPVLIGQPGNGRYGATEYEGSGKAVARAVQAAFAAHSNHVRVVPVCESFGCLNARDDSGEAYLVVPQILHWEDRATEWSGKLDRIKVKVSVYETGQSDPIASRLMSGKSKWATFGGDKPQDLLNAPISNFVDSLY